MDLNNLTWPLSKEELEYLYLEERMTQKEIGSIFGLSGTTISNEMIKYDIKTRSGKTQKEFETEVAEMYKKEYKVTSNYINSTTDVELKHSCGWVYKANPNAFLRGKHKCPVCHKHSGIRNKFILQERINRIYGENRYKVMTKYKGAHAKVEIEHFCGWKYKIKPAQLMQGIGKCPVCNNTPFELDDKIFKEKVKKIVGEEYTILSKYKSSKEKVKIRHNKCGNVFLKRPSSFLKGQHCPKCAHKDMGLQRRKKHDQFLKEFNNKFRDKLKLISKYKTSKHKVKAKCKDCGTITEMRPNDFLSEKVKIGCRKCANEIIANSKRKTTSEFAKEIKKITNGEYLVLGKYTGVRNKIKIKHKKCGHIWEVNPNDIIGGSRCPVCAKFGPSKGEKKIINFLENRGLDYKWQHRFEECANKNPLPFDFLIDTGDEKVLLEYDGIQHFKPIDYFGGKKGFIYRKNNDEIKNEYCTQNDIRLIRISYWEKDNTEEILEEELLGVK